MNKPLISIVVPVRNEAQNIELLYARVNAAMESTGYAFEVVVSDNLSTDGTRSKLRELMARDLRWKGLFLSRNFGHQNSLFCGLKHALGDAVISLDGDLQDPPEVIPQLIEKWEDGAEIVNTVRSKRPGENPLRMLLIHAFYRLMSFLSGKLITSNSGDFRLISRRALRELLKLRECNIYIRGLIPLLGFNQQIVFYERESRENRGKSKMNLLRLSSFALDGLTSTTMIPLRLAFVLGLTSLIASAAYGTWVIYHFFFRQGNIPGWTTLSLLITFYGGAILMMIGIVGEYLGRVFYEVKERPRFIVAEYLGIDLERMILREPSGTEHDRSQPVQ